MTVLELSQKTGYQVVAGETGTDKEVTGIYCGDLLSWVMGKAGKGNAWITVIGNVNSAAVALLADVSCIVLSEGSKPDNMLLQRADREEIPVLVTGDNTASAVIGIHHLLCHE